MFLTQNSVVFSPNKPMWDNSTPNTCCSSLPGDDSGPLGSPHTPVPRDFQDKFYVCLNCQDHDIVFGTSPCLTPWNSRQSRNQIDHPFPAPSWLIDIVCFRSCKRADCSSVIGQYTILGQTCKHVLKGKIITRINCRHLPNL